MALDDCVKEIVCGLGNSSVAALRAFATQLRVILEGELLSIEAQLLQADILSLPPRAANALAQAALSEIREKANIVPLKLLGGCVDLGNVNLGVTRIIDVTAQAAQRVTDDASRLLSWSEELTALRVQIQEDIQLLDDLLAELDLCDTIEGFTG